MKWYKRLIRTVIALVVLYAVACLYVWSIQENLLFHPSKLNEDKPLLFGIPSEEIIVPTEDGNSLNGALFKADSSNGKLVFFLHGNAGNIQDQEGVAQFYTKLGYDFFSFDYRGFGKSSGEIVSENQFYDDARQVYQTMKDRYSEDNIIIIGYSIGSAAATMLAAENSPSKLVLMAPYYSMEDLAVHLYKVVPRFIVSYKFETGRFLQKVNNPVCIFHGKRDETIPFYSSKWLAGSLKKNDLFIPLENQGHDGIEQHPVFQKTIISFLQSPIKRD